MIYSKNQAVCQGSNTLTTTSTRQLARSTVKNDASFSHYSSGNLYYNVDVLGSTYQFPIATIENDWEIRVEGEDEVEVIHLAQDLGTTPFTAIMKGSLLNRWIQRAIENDEFVKIR